MSEIKGYKGNRLTGRSRERALVIRQLSCKSQRSSQVVFACIAPKVGAERSIDWPVSASRAQRTDGTEKHRSTLKPPVTIIISSVQTNQTKASLWEIPCQQAIKPVQERQVRRHSRNTNSANSANPHHKNYTEENTTKGPHLLYTGQIRP